MHHDPRGTTSAAGRAWFSHAGLAGVLTAALFGCAAPGSAPGSADDAGLRSTSPVPATTAAPRAACAEDGPVVARPGGPSSAPSPAATTPPGRQTDEQRRAEEFLRQQAANDAFRQRGTLPDDVVAEARACAAAVARGLNLLTAGGSDSATPDAVERVIEEAGLTEVTVRPPGRLDLGPGNGLVFAGWTGRACVFGTVTGGASTVEFGTRIADGGCLPAPG